MESIGLFEAKTKFSELCNEVAKSGKNLVVTRRGKPLVKIVPVEQRGKNKGSEIARMHREFLRKHGPLDVEFELPPRSRSDYSNPLDR